MCVFFCVPTGMKENHSYTVLQAFENGYCLFKKNENLTRLMSTSYIMKCHYLLKIFEQNGRREFQVTDTYLHTFEIAVINGN